MSNIFINEFHYIDDLGTSNNYFEIAGPAGANLSGWTIVLYHGSNGQMYQTIPLSGIIDNEGAGYGALQFNYTMAVTEHEGIVLIAPGGQITEFISYGGAFTATNGPASGRTSTDVNLALTSSSFDTDTIGRFANGETNANFGWVYLQATAGSINNFQNFMALNDTINGTAYDDYIHGGGGNDQINGGTGNDVIIGGLGADTMRGGTGNDIFAVHDAGDTVIELINSGIDLVRVSLNNYALTANVENADLYIAAGVNYNGIFSVVGNGLDNKMNGTGMRDDLYGSGGNDVLNGKGGTDELWGGAGDDVLNGGNDDDIATGDIGNDAVNGGDGNDELWGNAGLDTLKGGNGNDTLYAGDDADKAYGGNNNDVIYGEGGNDVIYGDAGLDWLEGGDGTDKIYGGTGDDIIIGGDGKDVLNGGAGLDIFRYTGLSEFTGSGSFERIQDFSQADGDLIHINFNTASNDSYAFLGLGAFAGGAGELRYYVQSGNTYVQGDDNGDGVADFTLRLDGVFTLQASDFDLNPSSNAKAPVTKGVQSDAALAIIESYADMPVIDL